MKVVITAAGTGGHIYPALAIVDKIKKENPDSEFLYIGTTNRMEKDIIPKYGIEYIGIEIYGLQRKISLRNFLNVKCLIMAIIKSKKVLKKFKPDIVIGAGGYISFPVIYAASKLKIPTLLHEQNSVIGLSNKMALKYVSKIALTLPINNIDFKGKSFISGNPCGDAARNALKKDKKDFDLTLGKKLVVIAMGSLGSESVNSKIDLNKFKGKDYEVVFATGEKHYEEFISKNEKHENVKIVSYINEFYGLVKNADVLVSRAGATTLSEIMAMKVPSILIPSPYVSNNHQFKNAKSLIDNNSALLLNESDFSMDLLIEKIESILNNEKLALEMKENLEKQSISNSSDLIYKEIEKLVGN